jgi:predicted transposase/invertase (TIGR01784 family)
MLFFTRNSARRKIRLQAKRNAAAGKTLNVMQDIVFKALFTGNDEDSKEALRCLLSDCTGRPISNTKILNSEIIQDYILGKTVRLDIHATFNDGEQADIEIQTAKGSDNIQKRSLVYAAMLLAAQAKRGEQYKKAKRVYQIMFLDFILFPRSAKIPRRYFPMEETEHEILDDIVTILYFEMPKLEQFVLNYLDGKVGLDMLRPEQKWCIYFKYKGAEQTANLIEDLCRQEEGIMRADKALKRISRSEEHWARSLFRLKASMDYASEMGGARDEGKAEGIEIGTDNVLALMDQGYTAEQIREKLNKKFV